MNEQFTIEGRTKDIKSIPEKVIRKEDKEELKEIKPSEEHKPEKEISKEKVRLTDDIEKIKLEKQPEKEIKKAKEELKEIKPYEEKETEKVIDKKAIKPEEPEKA